MAKSVAAKKTSDSKTGAEKPGKDKEVVVEADVVEVEKKPLDPRSIEVYPDGLDKDPTLVYIRDPDRFDRSKADSHKTKAWYKALEDGCLPQDKMLHVLREKNIWSSDQEAETTELQEEMSTLLETIENGGISLEDAKANSIRVVEIRNILEATISQRLAYLTETIEAKARQAEFDYFVYCCTVYDSNRRTTYFKDFDDYMNKKGSFDSDSIAKKCSEVLYGIPDLDDTPEKQFLREYGFVDDQLRLINEEGHLVDMKGRLIDEYGNYIKYVGRGDKKRVVFVDVDGKEMKDTKKKPFLDKDGKPVKLAK